MSLPRSLLLSSSSHRVDALLAETCLPKAAADDDDCTVRSMRRRRIAQIWCRVLVVYSTCLAMAMTFYFSSSSYNSSRLSPLSQQLPLVFDKIAQRRLNSEEGVAAAAGSDHNENKNNKNGPRVLYVITSLAEYNSGRRGMEKGSDRLQETLIPVMRESVNSMMDAGFQVDVFLVCHFKLNSQRENLIRSALPASVSLSTWYDASPIGYDTSKTVFEKVFTHIVHLSRQHRFVVKDKLFEYDLFACFEDDMIIHGSQIQHWIDVTNEINRLRQDAPENILPPDAKQKDAMHNYHGHMTKGQLKRTIPGLMRVEALVDEENYGAQKNTGPVPVDLNFNGEQRHINPAHCCHLADTTKSPHIPENPSHDKIIIWETSILPLGVRQMPPGSWLDWVVLQRGPSQTHLPLNETIGEYWVNENDQFWPGIRRPAPLEFKYINNQGGWIATQQQIWEWHTDICLGGFLPPYEAPHYKYDGLDMRNVEWYSGAMQLSTVRHACNMQRIILLDPEHFSKSLLYHSANNKQRQLYGIGNGERFTKADTLLGQLNTVKKRAEAQIVSQPQ